jgi:protein TonB
MSSINRTLRATLHYLPIRAACYAACIALACTAAQARETRHAQHSVAKIDFASCAKPVYPDTDAQAGHEGTVTLGFLVDKNGHVKESKITRSSGFGSLDTAAQTALGKCSFHPALKNGKPAEKWAHVQYVWKLQ